MALVNHATGSLFDETSLVAYYKLENLNDSGPSSYTLTGVNTPTFVAAKYSNGMNLAAASSQTAYTLTNLLGGSSCTASYWVKLTAETGTGTMLLFSNADNPATNKVKTWMQYTYISAGVHYLYTLRWKYNVGYDYNTAPPAINFGTTWHHIVYTWDTAIMRTYFDGKLYDSWPSAGYGTGGGGDPIRFDIGAQLSASYLSGLVDEFLIFTRVWTAQEVYNYYQQYASAVSMGSNF